MSFQQAQWIWLGGDPQHLNTHGLLGRDLSLAAVPGEARLAITADARYWVWVNGSLVGNGPVRSWPQEWSYDVYDVAPLLRAGRNAIAVLVQHIGVGNFQYIAHRPGLLAELTWTDENGAVKRLGTDARWLTREHPGYLRHTPRITCQMAFAEVFDAREIPAGWPEEVCGEGWSPAVVIAPPEGGPWPHLRERDIPFLTEEPHFPARVRSARLVQPGAAVWSLSLRPQFVGAALDSNPRHSIGIATTTIHLAEPAAVTFASRASSQLLYTLYIDGAPAPPRGALNYFDRGDVIEAFLGAGEHLLAFAIDAWAFEWSLSVHATPRGLDPALPGREDARFAFVGPFAENEMERFRACAALPNWAALTRSELALQIVPREQEYPVNVLGEVLTARMADGTPAIEPAQALAGGSMDWTEVLPDKNGAAIEIELEFEKLWTGWLEFEAIAPAGVTLDFYGFETYQDGHRDVTFELHNTMQYVTREGYQQYRSIVRRGVRYLLVVIRGLGAPMRLRRVAGILSTYPAPLLGDFRSSDPLLDRIYEISRWTTRMCMEDTFVDCPTYEQTFWVGDARNAGAAALAAFGAEGLVRRCLHLAARSLERSPLVESQVPSAWENILTTWSFLWALACEEYYNYSGDPKFLEAIYPALAQQARYCRDHLINAQGLLTSAWDNLLEWAPMDHGGGGQATAVTHLNAWYVESCRRTAALGRALGKADEAEEFEAVARAITAAINEHFWDEAREAYIDCIHADGRRSVVVSEQTNTVCLLCGVATPRREALIRRYVGAAPAGFVSVCSPFMLFFTLEALERMGDYPGLLGRIRRTWGFMVEKGSTTCWENMPGWEPFPRWTRSQCHAWSAAPAYFLPTAILGVHGVKPGGVQARIAPKPVDLSWAAGRVPTPHGLIEVRWENAPRAFTVWVKLPPGVAGELELPVPATVFGRIEHAGSGGVRFERRSGHWFAVLAAGADFRVTAAK